MIPGIRLPSDVSFNGHRIDELFFLTTGLTAFYFVLVVVALGWFMVRYRARPGHRAYYTHGDGRRDFVVTGVLAGSVFVLIDMNVVRKSASDLNEHLWVFPRGPHVVRVEVLAQQWAWNVRYAGADGRFNTEDDVLTLNDLRVPVDRPVYVQLQAKDVIHSFYLPNLRVKQDAIPGTITRAWFQATHVGTYDIACAQMCGWAHYAMRGELTVMPQPAFDRWLADMGSDGHRRGRGMHVVSPHEFGIWLRQAGPAGFRRCEDLVAAARRDNHPDETAGHGAEHGEGHAAPASRCERWMTGGADRDRDGCIAWYGEEAAAQRALRACQDRDPDARWDWGWSWED